MFERLKIALRNRTKKVAFCERLCPNLTIFHRNRQLKLDNSFSYFKPILRRNATQNCNKTSCSIVPDFAKQLWFYLDFQKKSLTTFKDFSRLANASWISQKLFLQIPQNIQNWKSCWQLELSGWILATMQQNMYFWKWW